MKRPRKLTLLALTALAAVSLFLWMRSLISWRPIKLGQVNTVYTISFLSSDDHTALLMTDDFQEGPILDLNSGTGIGWPENFSPNVAFSQNSTERAFVFEDKAGKGQVRAREIQSGQLKRTFSWPRSSKKSDPEVLLSHDEKTLSVVDSASVFQWNIESGKLLRQLRLENPPNPSSGPPPQFILSPDGSHLIGCIAGQGKIWQLPSGHVLRSWTTKAVGSPVFFSSDARIVIYAYFLSSNVQSCLFVDATTGRILWDSADAAVKTIEDVKPSSFLGGDLFVLRNTGCEVLDSLTGHTKRELNNPRQSDGRILRVTPDHIYTQNDRGEIFRWRAR